MSTHFDAHSQGSHADGTLGGTQVGSSSAIARWRLKSRLSSGGGGAQQILLGLEKKAYVRQTLLG